MLSRKIGIDLGTSTVLIYVKGEGIVINEASLVGFDRLRLLHNLIGRVHGRHWLFKPEIMICVPSADTSAERRAVTEAAIYAGARQAWLIDKPLAAALGAGLPISEAKGNAICVVGARTTEIAVISRSGMVVAHSIPVGGNRIDNAIATHVKRRHNLLIDERTAEMLKIDVGSAVSMEVPLVAEAEGHDLASGLPRMVKVDSNDVAEAVEETLRLIAQAVGFVLEQTPPELAADIFDRGIVLSGGGAQLRGVDRYLARQAGIPASVAVNPQTSVVRGTGLALESFEVLKRNQSHLR
ncbi:MAG: rod shape-determining protein [Candidatus Dormibacteraceae bacterium]